MNEIRKQLTKLGGLLEQAKKDTAYKQGELSSLMAQLKEKHDINSVDQIQKKISKMEKEKAKLGEEIERDWATLQEFDWEG